MNGSALEQLIELSRLFILVKFQIWDLASGTLKLTLTGHINAVRGLAVSQRQPYLFSCAEDKQVKCWDLEYNKVIRHYHGHLSGVYCLSLHPTLDIMVTGGRDSSARVRFILVFKLRFGTLEQKLLFTF